MKNFYNSTIRRQPNLKMGRKIQKDFSQKKLQGWKINAWKQTHSKQMRYDYTWPEWLKWQGLTTSSAGDTVEHPELSYVVGGNVDNRTLRTVWQFLVHLNMNLLHDPAIPIWRQLLHKDSRINVHRSIIRNHQKSWKQPKYPSIENR